MQVNWHELQKAGEAAIICSWEYWLGKTSKLKANSTFELVGNVAKLVVKKFSKKENSNVAK